jgi:hypothetical protein
MNWKTPDLSRLALICAVMILICASAGLALDGVRRAVGRPGLAEAPAAFSLIGFLAPALACVIALGWSRIDRGRGAGREE